MEHYRLFFTHHVLVDEASVKPTLNRTFLRQYFAEPANRLPKLEDAFRYIARRGGVCSFSPRHIH
jgi:hypothetical protein